MLRIGICGGTFDPFHKAHLALVEAALTFGNLDKLLIIPAGNPPHKLNENVMPAVYRLSMVKRALRDLPGTEILELEILREGRSFTLDTIISIRAKYEEEIQIVLIYGSDILHDIEKWYKPAEIIEQAEFMLAKRGGDSEDAINKAAERLRRMFGAQISFFPNYLPEISSTDIRMRMEEGRKWTKFVPKSVVTFIEANGIYRFAGDYAAVDTESRQRLVRLEKAVWPYLTRSRLLHSVNVMMYAIYLARIHKVDIDEAAQAAILHDCAKCLEHNELMRYAEIAGDDQLMQAELAHGPAGAVMARELFSIDNQRILHAIYFHTTGCAGMSKLDKIIYLADKIELGRSYQDLQPIREAAETDLDKAMLICLTEVESFLKRSKRPNHPYAVAAVNDISRSLGI